MLDPEQIAGDHYFGKTAFADGEMVSTIIDLFDVDEADQAALRQQMHLVAVALAAEGDAEVAEESEIAEGIELVTNELGCTDCHRFHDEGDLGSAPDLTGYASPKWLAEFMANPDHERFYPDTNDRMPAFAESPDDSTANLLTPHEIDMLVRWLRGDDADLQSKPSTE